MATWIQFCPQSSWNLLSRPATLVLFNLLIHYLLFDVFGSLEFRNQIKFHHDVSKETSKFSSIFKIYCKRIVPVTVLFNIDKNTLSIPIKSITTRVFGNHGLFNNDPNLISIPVCRRRRFQSRAQQIIFSGIRRRWILRNGGPSIPNDDLHHHFGLSNTKCSGRKGSKNPRGDPTYPQKIWITRGIRRSLRRQGGRQRVVRQRHGWISSAQTRRWGDCSKVT